MDFYHSLFESTLSKKREELLESGDIKGADILTEAVSELYGNSVQHASDILYESIKLLREEMIEEIDNYDKALTKKVTDVWKEPLITLATIFGICEDCFTKLIDEERNLDEELNDNALALLFKFFSKSIVIAKETLVLIKAGYADGALSRWRSLHEVNVHLQLIFKDFRDRVFTENIVQRYLDYLYIEDARGLRSYQNSGRSIEKELVDEIKKSKEEILTKYGDDFQRPNMWAKPIFKKKNIYFHDLEKEANIEQLNLYYFQANTQVHTSVKGMFESLSMPSFMLEEPLINSFLSGNTKGLSIPIQLTAISLMQTTVKILEVLNNNLDGGAFSKLLLKLVEDCKEEAYRIEIELERTEETIFQETE